jgi:peptidoglycan LD-endopeptidase CwlK
MFYFGSRSKSKLVGVHPDLVKVISKAIQLSEVDFSITEGVRDIERQKILVKQGFSKTMNSKHLKQTDGYSHAVDVMAVGDLDGDGVVGLGDKEHTWDKELYGKINKAVEKASQELGIKVKWGGNFKSFFDGPHFELA